MKLLVSAINLKEAKHCIAGGADIIDVKNPREGSLGGHSPSLVRKIRKIVHRPLVLSATVGDVPNKPGLVAQASAGLASCGVDYIKIGLCDHFSIPEAIFLVALTVQAVQELNTKIKIAVCGYADASSKGIFSFKNIPRVVHEAKAHVAMIDTLAKGSSKSLFSFTKVRDLQVFCDQARHYGLEVALAGSLKQEDIRVIRENDLCDFIGIRTLACQGGKRSNAIQSSRVRKIKDLLLK